MTLRANYFTITVFLKFIINTLNEFIEADTCVTPKITLREAHRALQIYQILKVLLSTLN